MQKIKITLFSSIFVVLVTSMVVIQKGNYRFHKVFFYSFTKYVEWPLNYRSGDFIIGVYGQSEITPLLQEMAEIKKVGEEKIVIKTIDNNNLKQKINMIFIPNEHINNFTIIKKQLENKPTLIITESANMANNGSMINFKDVEGKLRFEVNTKEISQAGLKVSQELVRLGDEIK